MTSTADQGKLLDLKKQADKYLELYKENTHWKISTEKLENWHTDISNLGDRLIPIKDLIPHLKLIIFKNSKNSIYSQSSAKNIKHNMKETLKTFYSIFPILYKKIYGRTYREQLPNII